MNAPQTVTLDDLPCEIIEIIAQHLRDMPWTSVSRRICARDVFERVPQDGDLGSAAAKLYSDQCGAFSCVSKRYRRILFDNIIRRSSVAGYSVPCFERIMNVPEGIRANVRCGDPFLSFPMIINLSPSLSHAVVQFTPCRDGLDLPRSSMRGIRLWLWARLLL
jgi:hypothetical protein